MQGAYKRFCAVGFDVSSKNSVSIAVWRAGAGHRSGRRRCLIIEQSRENANLGIWDTQEFGGKQV